MRGEDRKRGNGDKSGVLVTEMDDIFKKDRFAIGEHWMRDSDVCIVSCLLSGPPWLALTFIDFLGRT